MTMRSWIRNLFTRPAARTIRKATRRAPLSLEALEDRWVPSTFTRVLPGKFMEVFAGQNRIPDRAVFIRPAFPGKGVWASL